MEADVKCACAYSKETALGFTMHHARLCAAVEQLWSSYGAVAAAVAVSQGPCSVETPASPASASTWEAAVRRARGGMTSQEHGVL